MRQVRAPWYVHAVNACRRCRSCLSVQVIDYLGQKRPKWPLALTDACNKAGAAGKAAAAPKAAAPAGGGGGGGGGGGNGPYFHGPIKKDKADELLLANGGKTKTGKFLFRQKGSSTNDFILSVIYKGAGTHHTVVRSGEGEEFALNKTPTGQTSLAELAVWLEAKRPKWPVPLTRPLRRLSAMGRLFAENRLS